MGEITWRNGVKPWVGWRQTPGEVVRLWCGMVGNGRYDYGVERGWLRFNGIADRPSLLMATRRGVGAARAVGRRAAPDALVAARAVPVNPIRSIRASVPVARRTAPFAVLLVVPVLVNPV